MKRVLLLIILISGFSQTAHAQEYGWTDISANMPALVILTDVQFIGEEGQITGGYNQVYYTSDGGKTFVVQQLPANSGIASSIFMKNNQKGYVVTYSGKILKTENGGTTWTTLHEPGGGFNSVHFPPHSDTGYTCGNNGKIFRFDDSSITDLSVTGLSSNLQSIFFLEDNTEGHLCGDSIIRRWLNNSWNNLQIFDSTFDYNSIFFVDNQTGWVVGTQGKIFRFFDVSCGFQYRT